MQRRKETADLDPELIHIIICFTDLKSLPNCMLVCKLWFNMATNDSVWQRHVSNLVGYDYHKNDERSYRDIYKKITVDLDERVDEFIRILQNTKIDDMSYPRTFKVSLPDFSRSVSEYFFAKSKELKKFFDTVENPAAIINRYLDRGGYPNDFIKDPEQDEDGPSLCYFMVCIGDLNCLRLLFNAGMDANGNLTDYSPLHLVAEGATFGNDSKQHSGVRYGLESENDLKVLECLIQHGADVSWSRETETPSPISFAVYNLRPRCVQMLLDNGASLEAATRYNSLYNRTYSISLIERLKQRYIDFFPFCSSLFGFPHHPDENIDIDQLILNVPLMDFIKEAIKVKLPTIQSIAIFKKMLRILLSHDIKISPNQIHQYELRSPAFMKFKEFLEKVCSLRESRTLLPELINKTFNEDKFLAFLMRCHQLKLFEIPASSQLANSTLPITMVPILPGELDFDPSNPTSDEKLSPGMIGQYVESSIVLLHGNQWPDDLISVLNSGKKIPCLVILCSNFNLILEAQANDVHTYIKKFLFVNFDADFNLNNIDFINEYLLTIFQVWRMNQPLFTEENHPLYMTWELGLNKTYHYNDHGRAVDGPPPSDISKVDPSSQSTYDVGMYKRKREKKDKNSNDDNKKDSNKKFFSSK